MRDGPILRDGPRRVKRDCVTHCAAPGPLPLFLASKRRLRRRLVRLARLDVPLPVPGAGASAWSFGLLCGALMRAAVRVAIQSWPHALRLHCQVIACEVVLVLHATTVCAFAPQMAHGVVSMVLALEW